MTMDGRFVRHVSRPAGPRDRAAHLPAVVRSMGCVGALGAVLATGGTTYAAPAQCAPGYTDDGAGFCTCPAPPQTHPITVSYNTFNLEARLAGLQGIQVALYSNDTLLVTLPTALGGSLVTPFSLPSGISLVSFNMPSYNATGPGWTWTMSPKSNAI